MNLNQTIKNLMPYFIIIFFTAIGIIFRIPFYTHYFVPLISVDSLAYADFASDILSKKVGIFLAYTPGYPLFILITEVLGIHTMKSFCLLQTIINFIIFLGIIYLLFSIKLLNNFFKYLIYITLIIFFNCSATLAMETFVSPMIFYSSLSLLFVFALLNIFYTHTAGIIKLCFISIIISILLLLRPQGIVLLPLFGLLILYLLLSKRYRQAIFIISIPTVVIFCTALYNYDTLGKFTYSSQGFYQSLRSSAIFLKKKDNQPPAIRNAIDSADARLYSQYPNRTKEQIVLANPAIEDGYADNFSNFVAGKFGNMSKGMQDTLSGIIHTDCDKHFFRQKVITTLKSQITLNSLNREFYMSDLIERISYIKKTDYFDDGSSEFTKKIVTKDFYPYYYTGKNLSLSSMKADSRITSLAFFLNTKTTNILRVLPLGYIYLLSIILFTIFLLICWKQLPDVPIVVGSYLTALIPLSNYLLIAIYVYPDRRYSYTSDYLIILAPILLIFSIYIIYFQRPLIPRWNTSLLLKAGKN